MDHRDRQNRPESKYKFTEHRFGFSIEAPNRCPMTVQLVPTGFVVRPRVPRQLFLFQPSDQQWPLPSANLIHYRRLVQQIAEGLMSRWRPPNGAPPLDEVKRRAISNTARAIGHRVHTQWKRLRDKSDPRVVQTQKAVFATGRFDPRILHEPTLYRDQYLMRDIQKYRAAASLVGIADLLYQRRQEQQARESFDAADADDTDFEQVVAYISDWQSVCSPTGRSYRSLRRTLMRLPGRVPPTLLRKLTDVHLERPVTDRVELISLLLSTELIDRRGGQRPGLERMFMHVTRGQIRDSMQLVRQQLARRWSLRRVGDMDAFLSYVLDYPEDHHGKLSSLARKAIRYHANLTVDDFDEFFAEEPLEDDEVTARPIIPLPKFPGVRFLETVGAIRQEGRDMNHCIGGYAQAAVDGNSFLFSVLHQGQRASVEVDLLGRVRQSYGPANVSNEAARYGRRVLGIWGLDFADARGGRKR